MSHNPVDLHSLLHGERYHFWPTFETNETEWTMNIKWERMKKEKGLTGLKASWYSKCKWGWGLYTMLSQWLIKYHDMNTHGGVKV
jgi:hypothetical protein